MASITQLQTAKTQLRVEHSDDDALIQIYIDAAEKLVNDLCEKGDEPFTEFPATVAAAVLLIVSDLYENREAQGAQLYRNETLDLLLFSNRKRSL